MNVSLEALMVLIESVWAVSARRAFDEGYMVGVYASADKGGSLAHAEDLHAAAMVLVRDEVAGRLAQMRDRVQTLYERASAETQHSKSQQCVLQLVLEDLHAANVVARSVVGELLK